jgi:DNA-directed RNA polymerase subunit K/omega
LYINIIFNSGIIFRFFNFINNIINKIEIKSKQYIIYKTQDNLKIIMQSTKNVAKDAEYQSDVEDAEDVQSGEEDSDNELPKNPVQSGDEDVSDISDSDTDTDTLGDDTEEEDGVDKPSFQSGLSKVKDALLSKLGEVMGSVGAKEGAAESEVDPLESMTKLSKKTASKAKGKGRGKRGKTLMSGEEHDYNQDDELGQGLEEGEYESEDDLDNKFKKFDRELRNDYLLNFHPESLVQNYDEIYNLARVVRDDAGNIIDELHKTLPILTKYEKTRILGQRAKQINDGVTPFVKVPENVIDGYLIALKELEEKKIPFIIRRPLPNRGSEYWHLEDLQIII